MKEKGGIKSYEKLSDLYKDEKVGTPIQQESNFTIHRMEEVHGTPVTSPVFRDNYYSFVLVKSGKSFYTIDDKKYFTRPNTLYFTNPTFDQLANIQLKGSFFITQKALPILNDGGRIVNISTGLARFSIPGYGAYAAMKSGIETYTRYLAKELGARQITANVVAPGAINTDMNKASLESNPELEKMLSSVTALGRVGVAEDIDGVVAFLASEDARWVNGQRIEASGGMFL